MNRHALLATATLLTGTLGAALAAVGPVNGQEALSAAAASPPTGVVVVVVDDMRADEMFSLPATRGWLARGGVTFRNAYAPTPLCCPARATLLTGKYAHNTGVLDNNPGGPYPGGFDTFDDSLTVATQLEAAGVATGYIGKYLNGYGHESNDSYVPPGWDVWKAGVEGEYSYRGPTTYNIDGSLVVRRGYDTRVQTAMATSFLRQHAGQPFYLQLNYLAPHNDVSPGHVNRPPVAEAKHAHDFDGYTVPRTKAFNEDDVNDKPPNMRRPVLAAAAVARIDRAAEARLEALQSVDDAMKEIRNRLTSLGIADSTDVIFLSDNGFLLGEHRFPDGKVLAYEPSARVPMLVAGPDAGDGVVRRGLVGLHDLASTVTGWFGLGPMPEADGAPLFGGGTGDRDILLRGVFDELPARSYAGLRTPEGYTYVEYDEGGVELYGRALDPLQVDNRAEDPVYAIVVADLARRLALLRNCAETSCR